MKKPYWEIRSVSHGYAVSFNESIGVAASRDTLYCFSSIDAALIWLRKAMKGDVQPKTLP